SRIVPTDSVIISCVGDLGLVALAGRELVINQQLHAFLPSNKINNRFLLYSLSLQSDYMWRVATKTAVAYLNKDNCNSIPVIFPSAHEQQKIADCLSSLDELLGAQTEKIEELKMHKKGLMQGLFPIVLEN
ncbi:MAG: restriction endonuclease subunit S, partial [Ferruginibacter sp.]